MSRKSMKDSLLFKNILTNITIIIILIASIVTVLYRLSANQITSEIETQINIKLLAAKQDIENTREGQEQQLTLLSKAAGLETLLKGQSTDEFDYQAKGLLENYSLFMENVVLIDSAGVVVYDSNNNNLVGTDLSSRSYFQESIKGNIAHSEILVSKSTGNFTEVISVPVIKNESVIGVLITSMNADYIKEILHEITVEENGYAFLLDENGSFIYHPDAKLIHTNIVDVGIKELTDAWPLMQAGEEGQVFYQYGGVNKMTMYLPIEGWTLSINAVKAEYLAEVNQMLIEIVLIGLSMLLLAAFVTALNSYFMIKKIKQVQHVLGEVTRGELSTQVKEKNLKKCWQIKECGKTDCVGYENDNLKCWEISSTLCGGEVQADAISKLDNCKNCKVFTASEGDELGQMARSLSIMITTIRNLISGVLQTSEQLSSSSQELSSSSEETTVSAESISERMEEMSQSSQNQTEYVEHINTMAHEMHSMLSDSSLKIEKMAEGAETVRKNAKTGEEKIGLAIIRMEEIKKQTEKVVLVMEKLIHQSAEIGEINGIITFIAEQTNLLSLNASIEAARAGVNGRGFGVVADEIGKLAAQTQESAQEISTLIENIKGNIVTTNRLMDEETEFVQNGIDTVHESKLAFEGISSTIYGLLSGIEEVVTSVEKVKESSESVTDAVTQMSGIIEESGADIEEISASTQEQTSISEEISNSALELARMAEELLESVSTFRV